MSRRPDFYLYPSLLDSYQDYLNSEETWLRFWGNSDTPSVTLEEFERKQFAGLIDKINRVQPAWEETEKRDRGTAFNEIVDCMILGSKSDKMEVERVYEVWSKGNSEDGVLIDNNALHTDKVIALKATYNKRMFDFPLPICREFADYFKGATPQVYCEAVLPTKHGDVLLYGFIDELMPTSIHDIKVTGSYDAWKFKDKWQRVVYPYCVNANGGRVTDFEYNILLITERKKKSSYETITEYYNYTDADVKRLQAFVEEFIEFLQQHRELILDTKIFTGKKN